MGLLPNIYKRMIKSVAIIEYLTHDCWLWWRIEIAEKAITFVQIDPNYIEFSP